MRIVVLTDGKLEYSAFGGGYFDPMWGTRYYITDWQVNNAAVIDKDGIVMQRTIYYPYGEPTIEPTGQRYLFGGKEREHAGGRNSYDFGARCLTPYGRWGVVDPEAERYYPISTYVYCGGDPINRIDRDGKVVIFINGFHFGSGGSSKYWEGIDSQIMGDLNDNKAMYYDGSIGGWHNLAHNLYSHYRHVEGMRQAYKDAGQIFNSLNNDESIKFVSHSMGASYTKGFIYGLKRYAAENNIDVSNKIEFELDLAPFQADKQIAHSDVPTVAISHLNDLPASPKEMKNAKNLTTREDIYPTLFTPYTEHGIKSFSGELNKIRKTYFAREDEN